MNLPTPRVTRQPVREAWSRERLVHERAIALGLAVDKSTSISYSSALNSYFNFCDLHNFDVEPTPETLSFYVAFQCHHINPRSVDSYLSGICNMLEPYFPHVRQSRRDLLVARTLKGCRRLRAIPVRRKDGLTLEDMSKAMCLIGSSMAHDDKLFLAQLLTGFSGLMRLGELVVPDNTQLQDSRKISLRHLVQWHTDGHSVFLPHYKADPFFEGNRIKVMKCDTADPHSAFVTYVQSRDLLHPNRPELWLLADGSRPTRSWFISRLKLIFPREEISGHSLRAGGATWLAEQHISLEVIRALGRWSSETFKIYIRKHPALLHASVLAHINGSIRSRL